MVHATFCYFQLSELVRFNITLTAFCYYSKMTRSPLHSTLIWNHSSRRIPWGRCPSLPRLMVPSTGAVFHNMLPHTLTTRDLACYFHQTSQDAYMFRQQYSTVHSFLRAPTLLDGKNSTSFPDNFRIYQVLSVTVRKWMSNTFGPQ